METTDVFHSLLGVSRTPKFAGVFWKLLALFTIVPMVELGLLLWVGSLIGFWPTFAIVLITGITGSILARREGLRAWRAINEALAAGQLPANELVDGLLILVAGAFLLTPGVLTDVAGISLLIPPARAVVREYLKKRYRKALDSQMNVVTLTPDEYEVQ